jgi:hypothetical protein
MTALQSEEAYVNWSQILERWFPVLAKAGCLPENPEDDFARLNTILRLGQEHEPVQAQATISTALMRGFGFDLIIARSEDLAQGSGRQLLGISNSPSSLLASTVAGIRGRTTSWTEDETICLGGIIGLDVSALAQVKTDAERNKDSVEEVGKKRMEIFLSAVGKFPEAILFWPSRRLTEEYPWRWAPASFLDTDGDVWMSELAHAECTDQGLLVKCPAIRIFPNQRHLVSPTTMYLEIQRSMSTRPVWDPSLKRWVFGTRNGATLHEICIAKERPGQEASWYEFFSHYGDTLYLLQESFSFSKQHRRQPVLVRILKTENNIRFAYYLASVRRADRASQDSTSCVTGDFEVRSNWCVG